MTIESLAFEKDFAQLSPEEQHFVCAEMTQQEFEHLRAVLLAARQMDADVLPPTHIKARLMKEMAVQRPPHLLRRPVPLWQAAAALIAISGLWLMKPDQVRVQTITEIQHRSDTVWLEKTKWRDRVVWRERIVYKERPLTEPLAWKPVAQDSLNPLNPTGWNLPRVGTSLGDTPELMDFFTQGD